MGVVTCSPGEGGASDNALNNQVFTIMKKTIIVLAALTGLVSAAEFTSSSYLKIDGNVSWDAAGTDKGSLDLFDVCADKTVQEIEYQLTAYQNGIALSDAPISDFGLANSYALNQNSITLSSLYNNTTLEEQVQLVSFSFISSRDTSVTFGLKMQVSDSSGQVLGVSETVTYNNKATTNEVYGVGTFSFGSEITLDSDTAYTYSLVNASTGEAYTGQVYYGEFKTWYSSNDGFKIDNKLQENYHPVISIQTKSIPEPTTATLSLLALAGLAAHRRRK